jgi:hypothetical protein
MSSAGTWWYLAKYVNNRYAAYATSSSEILIVLPFPLPIFIPPTAPQTPYNRPVVAAVPTGLSLTPLRIIKKGKLRLSL